ncbi:MAG TPA: response regulator transcription factor [Pyrinomonadaceae bacterium]|jgi:DNA-binding NarL/FixJ family response regulator
MAHANKLSIVIADDHPVFRVGLREIIESESGFKVVGEAGDGEEALEMIGKLHPAIAILDVSMPKLDGLAVSRKLAAAEPAVGVILVTMYREQKLFSEALDAGVKGYVLKDSAATDIISCIKAVAAGQHYASPELTTYLVNRVRQAETAALPRSELAGLTNTERRVLSLLADYKTSKEIAQDLFISARTVDTHRNNICQKLDIHGSHALMKFALAHKDLLP